MGVIDTAANIALCNQALGFLGAEAIVLDGTSQNHIYCETFFMSSRNEMLEAHPWNYASKRTFAIQTTDPLFGYDNAFTKPSDCLKVWTIAKDPLAVFEVEGGLILTDEGETPSDWATATDYIVGNVVSNNDITYTCLAAHTSGDLDDEPGVGAATDTYWTDKGGDYQYLPVEYVYQVTEVASYPEYLYQCVVYNLALKLCSPIKQETKTAVDLQTMLHGSKRTLGYLDFARSIDGQEGGGAKITTSKWLESRR